MQQQESHKRRIRGDIMPRIRKPYFEIRLEFDTTEERDIFEREVSEALKQKGYTSKREFLRDKIRELKGHK